MLSIWYLRKLFFFLVATLVSGCSIISSEDAYNLEHVGAPPNGVFYSLPKGLVHATLTANAANATFTLVIADPVFFPDPDYRYYVRHQPLPNFEDDLKVELNPGTSFLKSISSQSIDRTKEIIVNLARAAGAFGGFEASLAETGRVVIDDLFFDPTNPQKLRDVNVRFTSALRTFSAEQAELCGSDPPEQKAGSNEAKAKEAALKFAVKKSRCNDFERIAHGDGRVHIEVERLSQASNYKGGESYQHGVARTDCSVGVCYRPLEPYKLKYTVVDVTDTKLIDLPNKAPVIAIDFRRALFVHKIQNVTFDNNGLLRHVHIEKPSEILGATAIPLEVASAIAAGLQLRIDYVQRNIDIAESKEKSITAASRKASIKSAHHVKNTTSVSKALVSHNSSKSAARSYALEIAPPQPIEQSENGQQQTNNPNNGAPSPGNAGNGSGNSNPGGGVTVPSELGQ